MKLSLLPTVALAIFTLAPLARAQKRVVLVPDDGKPKTVAIDEVFEPAKLWAYTDVTLEAAWKDKGFKWLSRQVKDHGMIRRDNWGFDQMKLTAFGGTKNLEEISFLLKGGKLTEVSIAIWNKGDSQNAGATEKDFTAIIDGWTTQLSRCVAPKFEDRGKDKTSAVKAERRMWVGKEIMAQLEYSGGKEKVHDPNTGRERAGKNFQGEFIRLRLLPKQSSLADLSTSAGAAPAVRRLDLTKSLKREAGGDVFISTVPMVDQGDKGYCAAATAARVFNYYGVPADQHEMAQIAGNEAGGGGTNPDEMEAALRKIAGKFKTRFQTLLDLDYSSHKYQTFMAKYNRAAKKLGKRILDTDKYIYFLGGLDPEVLREVNGTGQTFERFIRVVHENIDKGVPVMWGLQLGLFPENGEKARQSKGGHMRLIIGYNDSKKEILFTDSWGAGHEKKRMASADASAATMGLYLLQPSS